jgi:hypothetical protein
LDLRALTFISGAATTPIDYSREPRKQHRRTRRSAVLTFFYSAQRQLTVLKVAFCISSRSWVENAQLGLVVALSSLPISFSLLGMSPAPANEITW